MYLFLTNKQKKASETYLVIKKIPIKNFVCAVIKQPIRNYLICKTNLMFFDAFTPFYSANFLTVSYF